jgi:hypothetical protein
MDGLEKAALGTSFEAALGTTFELELIHLSKSNCPERVLPRAVSALCADWQRSCQTSSHASCKSITVVERVFITSGKGRPWDHFQTRMSRECFQGPPLVARFLTLNLPCPRMNELQNGFVAFSDDYE